MELNQDFQKYIDTLKETTQSSSSRNLTPTQATSCQELIAEAIQTLLDAQSACCDCYPPVGCQCSGTILSCLSDASITYLGELTLSGTATINAAVCLNCQNPITSDLVFSFLTNSIAFPFSFNSFTPLGGPASIICNDSESITISGQGTLLVDGTPADGNYTFTFGNILLTTGCGFDLNVRDDDGNVFFSASGSVSCDDITITPCLTKGE